jgi:hypothetical protein
MQDTETLSVTFKSSTHRSKPDDSANGISRPVVRLQNQNIAEPGKAGIMPATQRRIPMVRISLSLCLVAALSLIAAHSAAPGATAENTAPAIKGIWTIEAMDVGIGENRRTTVPQAFMLFIGDKYYSAIRDFSPEPRKISTGEGSSGQDSRAFLGSFMADAGTYEYNGSTFVVHHKVGMIPSMMDHGSSMTFGCQMEGNNTLILSPQYDKMVMPGMKIAPSPDGKMGYGDMAVRYKFKRLE